MTERLRWLTLTRRDDFLRAIGSSGKGTLGRIAWRWGLSGSGSAATMLPEMQTVLDDPGRREALLRTLAPFEGSALTYLRLRGGSMPSLALAAALRVAAHPYQDVEALRYDSRDSGSHPDCVLSLSLSGVAATTLLAPGWRFTAIFQNWNGERFPRTISLPELYEAARPVPPQPLELEPLAAAPGGMLRRPVEVSLTMLDLLERIRTLSPFELTNRGRFRKPFVTKIAKAFGWDKALPGPTGLPLHDPGLFHLYLAETAGLLAYDGQNGLPSGTTSRASERWAELDLAEQARVWTYAYEAMTGWSEEDAAVHWITNDHLCTYSLFNGMRALLLAGLGALPDPHGWYSLPAFSDALCLRSLGEVRLGYAHSYRNYANLHPKNRRSSEALFDGWAAQALESWRRSEQCWITAALCGPLFQLGLVEVATARGPAESFRLTDLGRLVLYDALRYRDGEAPSFSAADGAPQAWHVQPNFEVLVYLDHVTPLQLAFLGRIALRRPGEGPVATYLLTRDSIYAGLQGGLDLETISARLAQDSRNPLPDNVTRAFRDWAARRERLQVFPASALLEFADAASREAVLAAGEVAGEPVGDRFLRIPVDQRASGLAKGAAAVVDYNSDPVRCLHTEEDGSLTLDGAAEDLLIRGELSAWAEADPLDARRYRITQRSVSEAIGWTADAILTRLRARTVGPVPLLLETTIRNWAAKRATVRAGVATVVVLQVAQPEAAGAIAGSPSLAPLLVSRLGPTTFLVRSECAAELTERLRHLGFHPADDLSLVASGTVAESDDGPRDPQRKSRKAPDRTR